MTAGVRQLLGLGLAIASFVGSIIICALPQWRVTKFLNGTGARMDDLTVSEGLWKACITTRMDPTHCQSYGYWFVSVTKDLEVARALIIIANIIVAFGILLSVAGSKFTNFVPDKKKNSKMAMASGVALLTAGIFVLIPVRWTTTTIEDDFNNHLKRELGASVYIACITTVLLFLGGGLLCSSYICRGETD